MSRLRFGILSTADIARKKVIPGMRTADRVEVVAIASRERGTAARVAAELAIPRAHGSYEALLADPDVDAVYIPLPEPPPRSSGRSPRPRPASTSCARSRSRSPPTTPSGWSTPATTPGSG